MMFINSIFLPKTLSDQPTLDGNANSLGSFSHLFSNVFRFVKEGQENSNPLQLIQTADSSIENLQNELLKVSLSADNKIVRENSSISMIVSLFVSQFRPGETVPQTVDNNKIKASENAPKYFSLSKDDLVKEIKNLFDSLEDINVSQSGNAEISLLANGIMTPLNFENSSVSEIENLIASQVTNKNDFKLSIKIGNQTLTLDVQSIKQQKREAYNPVEIVTENEQPASIKSTVTLPIDKNQMTSKENVSISTGTLQPQLEGVKQALTDSENKIADKNIIDIKQQEQQNQQTVKTESIVKDLNHNIIDSKVLNENPKSIEFNATNPLPVIDKKSKAAEVSEQDKKTFKSENMDKDPKPNLNEQKVLNDTAKLTNLNTTELPKTEKKISIKSNQKMNSVLMNNSSVEESIKLNDLAGKTEVKEIKVDVKSFVKKNSEPQIQRSDVKQDNVLLKADIEKQVKANVKPVIQSPIEELKSDKQVFENKTIELKPNTITNETVKKVVQNLPNDEVMNKSANTFKQNSETIKSNQQELFTEDNDVITSKEINNKSELKTETKSVASDWFKNKTVEEQKPLAKTNNVKTLNQVETKTETAEIFDSNSKPEYSEKEKVVKSVNDPKTKLTTNPVKTSTEKIFTQEKELKLNDTTEKVSKIPTEQANSKPEKNIKEVVKPVQNIDENTEEVKVETTIHKTDVKENKVKNQTAFELKDSADIKEPNAVKIDFKERRVYSHIPKLEVIVDDKPIKNSDNKILSNESTAENKTKLVEEPVKPASNIIEPKVKEEKQVWVKVSVEKSDVENQEQIGKSSSINKATTILSDDTDKDLSSGNYSQDDSKDQLKQKPQTASMESSQNSDTKTSVQTQNSNNQHEAVSSIKPEHKTDQTQFKSELHNENVKYSSRTTEIVEKVKVISSGEMVREVYKVLENGEKQSIVLKLVPKELGAIKVMLDTVDNVLTAKVEVENETVGQVIRNNVEQLKQNLLQSGVHVNSINISYSSSQQKQHGFNNQKKKNSGYQQDNNLEEVDEAIITKKLGYNTYEYLA